MDLKSREIFDFFKSDFSKNNLSVSKSGFASYSIICVLLTNLIMGYPSTLNLSAVAESSSQSISMNLIFVPLICESPISYFSCSQVGFALLQCGHQMYKKNINLRNYPYLYLCR